MAKIWFIDALRIIDLCIEHGILATQDDHVIVVHESGDRYLWPKDELARELMEDMDGQKVLLDEMEKRGIPYTPYDHVSFRDAKEALKDHKVSDA